MKMMILSIFSHLKNKPRRSCKLGFYAAENQNNLNYSSSSTSSSREEQEEKETTKGREFTGFCAEWGFFFFCFRNCTTSYYTCCWHWQLSPWSFPSQPFVKCRVFKWRWSTRQRRMIPVTPTSMITSMIKCTHCVSPNLRKKGATLSTCDPEFSLLKTNVDNEDLNL